LANSRTADMSKSAWRITNWLLR